MKGTVIKEGLAKNGMFLQIVKTNECSGRYYLVVDGESGFHSLDFERVEKYMNDILGYKS